MNTIFEKIKAEADYYYDTSIYEIIDDWYQDGFENDTVGRFYRFIYLHEVLQIETPHKCRYKNNKLDPSIICSFNKEILCNCNYGDCYKYTVRPELEHVEPFKCKQCKNLNCFACYKDNCAYCHLRIFEGLDLAISNHNKKNVDIIHDHLTYYVNNNKEYFEQLFH